jgi:hypothetical protein
MFILTTSTPALIKDTIARVLDEEGPSVATILVRLYQRLVFLDRDWAMIVVCNRTEIFFSDEGLTVEFGLG